jgi:helix-turn-helix, Psq domain
LNYPSYQSYLYIQKKLSRRKAAKIYNIPHLTLSNKMAGRTSIHDYRPVATKLSNLEKKVIVQYILNLDNRGFGPRLASMEDMANYLLESQGGKRVGKL